MAEADTTPALYAVMGRPVAHSRSPAIHKLFAKQLGHQIEYSAIEVAPGEFPQAVEQFRAGGGKGLNGTGPFKQESFALTDNVSERARLAGAVNTLKFETDGAIFGDNTDGAGLGHHITKNLGGGLKGREILGMGA